MSTPVISDRVELHSSGGSGEPAFEPRRTDSRSAASGHQGAIVQLRAEIASVNVSSYLAGVVLGGQYATDELVKPKFVRAGYLNDAIRWWAEHEIRQCRDDVVRKDRLYQGRRYANGLSVTERIGDAPHELEELCGAQNRVRNSGSLDQAFLRYLRA